MTPAEARAWGHDDRRRLSTRDFPFGVVALVDERQGGRFCMECRRGNYSTPADEPLELDHLRPLAKGGDNRWSNLQWLCRAHNRSKCDRAAPAERPTWARGPGR